MRKKRYTKMVATILSEETYAKLIEITDKEEVPYSAFIRNLIEDKIKETQVTV